MLCTNISTKPDDDLDEIPAKLLMDGYYCEIAPSTALQATHVKSIIFPKLSTPLFGFMTISRQKNYIL